MARLSQPELRVIRTMLAKEFGSGSPLLDGTASLEFDIRHMTGTGFYVHFSNARKLPRASKSNIELSEDYRTNRQKPCDLVGFTLFIRDGYLSSFEGYTFGDVKWPEDEIDKWLVHDAT